MTESTYYSPDQFKVILPFLNGAVPKWLVLGGPADGNEAQCARRLWPEVRVVGVEPNADMVLWQHAHGWPPDAPLVCAALAAGKGEVLLAVGRVNPRGSSIDPWSVMGNSPIVPGCDPTVAEIRKVAATTLDDLDALHGPFEDAVVWLDIEGSEHQALLGAEKLLARRAPLLLNLEMQPRVPGLVAGIEHLMWEYGYVAAHQWNASETCWDRIYVRR